MEDVKKYIINFAKKKLGIRGMNDKELLEADYLGDGLLDSLQFIEMISDFEKKFGVRFSSKELSSGTIRTLGGIEAVIIKLKRSKKK